MGDLESGLLWEFAKSHRSDYLRQAAANRLLGQACSGGPGLRYRLTVAVGDRLIALGLSLKQRYDPRPSPGHLYGGSGP